MGKNYIKKFNAVTNAGKAGKKNKNEDKNEIN